MSEKKKKIQMKVFDNFFFFITTCAKKNFIHRIMFKNTTEYHLLKKNGKIRTKFEMKKIKKIVTKCRILIYLYLKEYIE